MNERPTNDDGNGDDEGEGRGRDDRGGRSSRTRIRRNAWLLAAVAAAIYLGYLWYLGTLGSGG